MTASAYDTAFVARVRRASDPNEPAYPRAVEWLLAHQNPDGSFGTTLPILKEQVLATVSAVLALSELPAGRQDGAVQQAQQRAQQFLWEKTQQWQLGPQPVAFEILLPSLLEAARARSLPLPYDRFAPIISQREAKIGHVPPRLVYNVPSPLLHSLEYLGDGLDAAAIRQQQAANGSFGNSPSATAFFLTRSDSAAARRYLDGLAAASADGGIPNVAPFDVFERAWVLANLLRAGLKPAEAQPHAEYLRAALTDDGVGIAKEGLRPDADDTALSLLVLAHYGHAMSPLPLQSFEGTTSFYCFPLERHPSVSANSHVLQATTACAPFPRRSAIQHKIVGFLRDAHVDGAYWFDKWHSSPLYATAHAVFALTAAAPDLCRAAVAWLRDTQRPDGSWGWYKQGTPEETAYAVQAWMSASDALQAEHPVDLPRARAYLQTTGGVPPTPLWIGKALYAPLNVVASAILAARALLDRRLGC